MKNRFARKIVAGRLQAGLEKLSGAFSKRAAGILFFSKFVYGTRTAAQVLAGLQAMKLRKYLAVNILGVFSLLMLTIVLAYSIGATVASVSSIVHNVEVTFLIFVVVIILMHLVFGSYIKKTWSR